MPRQNFKDLPITYLGKTQSFKQWVDELGCNYMLAANRYRYGHRKPEALFAPAGHVSSPPNTQAAFLSQLVGNKMAAAVEQQAKEVGLPLGETVKYLLAKALA